MAPWHPPMPWPGSAGGASSPHWGGYVRLYVRAALAAGRPFVMGQSDNDRLDSGNVLAGAEVLPRTSSTDRLWVDLSCDVLDVQISGGSTGAQGIFSKADAAACTVTLSDPEGIYDPLSPVPPWAYAGRSRLVPGVPVEVWAEVVDGDTGTVTRHWLFTGTADSWGEDWTPTKSKRQCKLIATDDTKRFARYDRPEIAPVGQGDTTGARIQRIVSYFDWPGTVLAPASGGTVTLQSTTLAQNAWELLNRTLDDELGYVHFTTKGELRWLDRNVWLSIPPPVLELGCETIAADVRDVLVDASPSNLDRQMRNEIYASRAGGATVSASSTSSIAQHGRYDYKRTDLGLADDIQVADWASLVLQLYAYPQIALKDVTLKPAIDPRSWEIWKPALDIHYVSELVRILWAPPDHPTHVTDALARVVGATHTITRRSWELRWQLVDALAQRFAGSVFVMGPDAQDRLDAGYVLGV
jgi:hypothetical protein